MLVRYQGTTTCALSICCNATSCNNAWVVIFCKLLSSVGTQDFWAKDREIDVAGLDRQARNVTLEDTPNMTEKRFEWGTSFIYGVQNTKNNFKNNDDFRTVQNFKNHF